MTIRSAAVRLAVSAITCAGEPRFVSVCKRCPLLSRSRAEARHVRLRNLPLVIEELRQRGVGEPQLGRAGKVRLVDDVQEQKFGTQGPAEVTRVRERVQRVLGEIDRHQNPFDRHECSPSISPL